MQEKIQQNIQQLIQDYEEEIDRLIQEKNKCSPSEEIYGIREIKISDRQSFVAELRALL